MQLRKLPVWFQRNPENGISEAIVEVKPRSLFRFEQPMLGWKPIVPPEELRKDLFLKRNGEPLGLWDHEQVESAQRYQWENTNTTNNSNNSNLRTADAMAIDFLKSLDLSKSSVIIDRNNYGRSYKDFYSTKEENDFEKPNPDSYENENLVFKQNSDQQNDRRGSKSSNRFQH